MNIFFDALKNKTLHDVFVGGYLEKQGVIQFNPMYGCLYFRFEDELFEIKADLQFSAQRVKEITPCFDVEVDDEFCIASIYVQCFKTEDPIAITSIEYYCEAANEETVLFFEINYHIGENRETVYFNPKNVFGVLISHGKNEKDNWLEEMHALKIAVHQKIWEKADGNAVHKT
ncbi:hypothetical protein ACO0LF_27435 [Undibacterium sp. Di27W]